MEHEERNGKIRVKMLDKIADIESFFCNPSVDLTSLGTSIMPLSFGAFANSV